MTLEIQINEEIKSAMRAKEQTKLKALRAVKSAILLKKTETGSDEISNEDVLTIIQKLVKQRNDSLKLYEESHREDLAEIERAEIECLTPFLPAQLSDEELNKAVKQLIEQLGATSVKDMGKVMGAANKSLKGKADGARIASTVKAILQ